MKHHLSKVWDKIYRFFTAFPDLSQSITKAYRSMSFSERMIFVLFIIGYILSAIIIIYNQLHIRYSGLMMNLLVPPAGAAGYILLYFCCINTRRRFPRLSYFFLGILFTILFVYSMFVTCGAAMLTPSTNLLNIQLKQWDLALGFHQLPIIIWSDHHLWLHKYLNYAYNSWPYQLALVCPVLALFKQYKQIIQWTLAGILGIIIVSTIYYYYPSLPPASVYPQYHFDVGCYECIDRFYLLHAYQPFAFTQCGLIVFPSCHVLYALLTTYAFRNVKWLLWPLIVLNSMLIASTVMLGMHFLVDVIAAFVLFIFISLAAHWATKIDDRTPAELPP